MGKKIEKLADVIDVDIAEAGCFKYVLIKVREREANASGQSKLVVRGDASCAYHADVLDILENQIDQSKLILNCQGGGRIRVNPQTRTISVYGYSQGFGRADHQKTVELIRKDHSEWNVEITSEEY